MKKIIIISIALLALINRTLSPDSVRIKTS